MFEQDRWRTEETTESDCEWTSWSISVKHSWDLREPRSGSPYYSIQHTPLHTQWQDLCAMCLYIIHCALIGWEFQSIVYSLSKRDKNRTCHQDRNTKIWCGSAPNIHAGSLNTESPHCPHKASRRECFVWICSLCVRATRRQWRSSLSKHATVSCMNTPGQ